PPPGHVLGFDDDAGMVAMVDVKSRPLRIDLRRDSIESPIRESLVSPVSLDGSAIYGVTARGAVVRTTPAGEWRYAGPRPARGVLPLRDGSLLIWTEHESQSLLTRVKPPSTATV